MKNPLIVFLMLRWAIAASMLGHGLARLPKLQAFSNWMVTTFQKSILPEFLVKPFSYILPVTELSIGVLLFLGLFTKIASLAGTIVMIVLIFGTCMIENWEALPSQMIHVVFFAGLVLFLPYNKYSIDSVIRK